MRTRTIRHVALAAMFALAAGCGGRRDEGKTEGGKTKLVAEQECPAAYTRYRGHGSEERFVAACKQDMALIACAGPAKDSGFCQRAATDARKRQLIAEMSAALSTP